MVPHEIEIFVSRYNEYKEPLYAIRIYSRGGRIILSQTDVSKEMVVKYIAHCCGVTL